MEFVRGIAVQVVWVIAHCVNKCEPVGTYALITPIMFNMAPRRSPTFIPPQLVQALGVARKIFGFHHNDLLSKGETDYSMGSKKVLGRLLCRN